jgi:hypothetical protein
MFQAPNNGCRCNFSMNFLSWIAFIITRKAWKPKPFLLIKLVIILNYKMFTFLSLYDVLQTSEIVNLKSKIKKGLP